MNSGLEPSSASSYIDIASMIGGDEALAFVEIAANMYLQWAARHGYTTEVLAREPSWVLVGFHKLIRLRIDGVDPVLLGARENGTHSLVRFVEATVRRHMAIIGVRVSNRPDIPLPDDPDAWGGETRRYMLEPEPRVTDRPSGAVSTRAADVLNGDLELIWGDKP